MAARTQYGFVHWLTHVKLFHLVVMLVVILITVPLMAHYYISNMSIGSDSPDSFRSRTQLEHIEDLTNLKPSDLKFRIEELRRIKASVNNELRELENKRQKLYSELSTFSTRIDSFKQQMSSKHLELEQIEVNIKSQKAEEIELGKQQTPQVQAPRQVLPPLEHAAYFAPPKVSHHCRMHNCFDYSRCSLTSHFPVYLYSPGDYQFTNVPLDTFVKLSVMHAFDTTPHFTLDPNIACLYVVLIGDVEGGLRNATDFETQLQQLPFWHGDGRNHLLLTLARSYWTCDIFEHVNTGRAMLAQSMFTDLQLRPKFDILLPPSLGISHGQVWDQLPPIAPARRKYLMSFQGEQSLLQMLKSRQDIHSNSREQQLHNAGMPPSETFGRKLHGFQESVLRAQTEFEHLANLEKVVVETLKQMQSNAQTRDSFLFSFACEKERLIGVNGEWALCGPDSERHEILRQSTFVLIIAPVNYTLVSTTHIQVRIYEALKYGAVPVILGDYTHLPFDSLITWKKAAVFLPKARITELHFLIRTYIDHDILVLRRQGRVLWEQYFGTTKNIIDMMLAEMRTRLGIPAFPVRDQPAPSVFNETFVPLTGEFSDPQQEQEEVLGPLEPQFPSPKFRRNFTVYLDDFNTATDPFHLYPYAPFEPLIPGEAKFLGSGIGYRPIGGGEGGSGKEFNEALGGNLPREQFTIVMLTYERDAVLVNALARFKGLPHLNKVIVVWNSPKPPAEDLRWPDIGTEIHVVRTSRNSLNNRFLPYDAIATEAILSLDDDAHLRHDEILFGFRVWRESRERIVGFPGRFHAWDLKHNKWLYNSNYSCELSMVLTGAAFFHKYYAYVYSNIMPQAIRDKVDEYLNCEDIAMNFLVAHITRKPPIKVTSRWTFRCPGCPNALSVEEEHFNERHRCINFFTKVYGYMPLLYTQFRVDSVLFKTRIPHDKQKCFKYV